jgi:hypothetical protein
MITSALEAASRSLEPIRLEEIGEAALLSRIDRKHILPQALIPGLLAGQSPAYRILEIQGGRIAPYRTLYFDTPDLALYRAHHAGRPRRYKIRVRRYGATDASYLEVKFRNLWGRTQKERVLLQPGDDPLAILRTTNLLCVMQAVDAGALRQALRTDFCRITLVRRDGKERVTLDVGMEFTQGTRTRCFPGVAIAEIKQSRRGPSPILAQLRAADRRQGSLSKYCIGIACLDETVKSNLFLPTLRRLNVLNHAFQAGE